MKLHIARIRDLIVFYLENEYVTITTHFSTQQIKEKQEHDRAMLEITSDLSYSYFDDIKDYDIEKKMWEKVGKDP